MFTIRTYFFIGLSTQELLQKKPFLKKGLMFRVLEGFTADNDISIFFFRPLNRERIF